MRIFILAAFILAAFTSCIKDEAEFSDFAFSASPEWGIPLARLSLSAERVIDHFDKDGLVFTGEDGMVRIIYADTLQPINADDYLNLPDQSFGTGFQLETGELSTLISEGSVSISQLRTFSFESSEGDRLDSLRFNDGVFRLVVQSSGSFPVSGSVHVLAPDSEEVLYQVDFTDSTLPVYVEQEQSLSNTLLEFVNDGNTENGLRIGYDLNFTYDDNGSNTELEILLEWIDFGIESAGGFIAPRTFDLEDSGIDITMFDNIGHTEVRIEDPRINFYFENGFGLGVALNIHELFGMNAEGESLTVPGANISLIPQLMPAPEAGQLAVSQFTIDNSLMTPSITDFLAFAPNFVTGDFSLTVNPDANESVFISSGASLLAAYEVDIPVYGSLANFSLVDTAAIGLTDIVADAEEVGEVTGVDLRLVVNNGLPLDALLQIVFVDSLYQPVDSLFEGQTTVFGSAPLELSVPEGSPNYGRAIGFTNTILEFPISKERLLALDPVRYIIVRVKGHTTSNGEHPIRLFAQDRFDTYVGAKIKLQVDE